jgi:hypothetical protein
MRYYLTITIFLTALALLNCAPKKAETMNADQTQTQSQPAENSGTLSGRVTIGPLCPVERIDQPCDPPPEMYAAHRLVLLATDGKKKIQEIKTDAKGYYKAQVPAGDYLLDYQPHDIGIGEKPPRPVHVDAGKTTKLNVEIDTGIR